MESVNKPKKNAKEENSKKKPEVSDFPVYELRKGYDGKKDTKIID